MWSGCNKATNRSHSSAYCSSFASRLNCTRTASGRNERHQADEMQANRQFNETSAYLGISVSLIDACVDVSSSNSRGPNKGPFVFSQGGNHHPHIQHLNSKSYPAQTGPEPVTGVPKRRSEPPFPRGLFRICIPPRPSPASPGRERRRAGAPPRRGPWTGRSGSTAPGGGGGAPSRRRAGPPTARRGSCTGRSTACCAPSPCCIPPPSHAARMTGRRAGLED